MDKNILDAVTIAAKNIADEFPVRMVILYGSCARGEERADSDIDLAVVFDRIDGDYLDLLRRVYRKAIEADDRIETVVLERGRDSSGFLENIMKSGKVVYEKTAA
ncbi:MAG: nucleotidyltransferase domain-containing protein [Spirochaetota bacterium]